MTTSTITSTPGTEMRTVQQVSLQAVRRYTYNKYFGTIIFVERIQPVSYTHLDVYKRQILGLLPFTDDTYHKVCSCHASESTQYLQLERLLKR